jgi:acetyl esterase/lipase
MKKIFLCLLACNLIILAKAQTTINLYTEKVPNSIPSTEEEKTDIDQKGILRISKVTVPALTVYLPPKEKANGTAVIICPGGGYGILAAGHEGVDVAKRFNEMGVTAFVLKYRLPSDKIMVNKEIGPIQDAQRAIEIVRTRAKEWSINKNRIGIVGFSAGGHLASTAGTHFQNNYLNPGKKANLRPDFMILGYPVISFSDSIGHRGSRNNLLGENPSPEKIIEYSNELQVTKKTPPTFLVHAMDDKGVPVQNSVHFYEALQKNKVASEIYLYEKGGHGFGMNNPTSDVKWMDLAETWMKKQGLIKN